jgi:hypothetical protein
MTAHLDRVDLLGLYNSGVSAYRLAKTHEVSTWAVLKRLREAGADIRPDGVPNELGLGPDSAWVLRQITDGLVIR